MKCCIFAITILLVPVFAVAEEADVALPKTDYVRKSSDPDWLAYSAQFHGHLGPWATAGFRFGAACRTAVGAKGYFDIQILVSGPFAQPPRACFLDGMQVATGATWGKRNITWVEAAGVSVLLTNTKTGKAVEARPTKKLLKLLTSFRPRTKTEEEKKPTTKADSKAYDNTLEAIAREIARLPTSEIATIKIRD